MAELSPLAQRVLSGRNRQLTAMAAQGLLPIAPGDLVSIQVELTAHPEPEIAQQARTSLLAMESRVLLPILQQEAGEKVLRFFSQHSRKGEILEALLRRRDVPSSVLLFLAPRLPADLQEILLLRQDRISNEPEILDELERNANLTAFSRRRIEEYRKHLITAPTVSVVEVGEEGAQVAEGIPGLEDPDIAAAIEGVRASPAAGEIDEDTGLSESQIRLLPIPVRLKLARGASKTLRGVLVRDNNPQVAVAVIDSNPLSDQEVEVIVRNSSVVKEVLERIARERKWISKYGVMQGLILNPRTPVGLSVKLIPRLAVRDLRTLARDRNVPEAVRSTAHRLYRIKSQ